MNELFHLHREFIVPQSVLLMDSYRHWMKRDLIPTGNDFVQNAKNLFYSPFAVLSTGLSENHLLNYGNETALKLWKMDWDQFCGTPSNQTAEPVHREARAVFLNKVRRDGFIENYEGIRISSRGERFRIQQATVWNLIDENGIHAGQAATFSKWCYCE